MSPVFSITPGSATLDDYTASLDLIIGTSSTNYYTTEMKVKELNQAIREFVDEYNPQELRKKVVVTFASGVATPPTDLRSLNRVIRLWNTTTNRYYEKVDPETYYDQDGDIYTLDYHIAALDIRLLTKDTTATTLTMHYITDPTVLVSGSDESGLNDESIEVIALMAAKRLFRNARDFSAMQLIKVEANEATRTWKGRNGNITKRLKSKYEKVSYHGRK